MQIHLYSGGVACLQVLPWCIGAFLFTCLQQSMKTKYINPLNPYTALPISFRVLFQRLYNT